MALFVGKYLKNKRNFSVLNFLSFYRHICQVKLKGMVVLVCPGPTIDEPLDVLYAYYICCDVLLYVVTDDVG